MKILHVIELFNPHGGGTVSALFSLLIEESLTCNEIYLISSDLNYNEEFTKLLRDKGIKIIIFPIKFNIFSFLYTPKIKNWLNEYIKTFDIIHLHNFRSYQNYIVACYASKYKIPIVLQAHGSFEKINKNLLKTIFDSIFGKIIINNARCFIAVSNYEKRSYMKKVSNKDIVVIFNGINLEKYRNLPEKGFLRKRYNISDSDPLIIFVGRFNKIKGLDFLIDSYELFKKKYADGNSHLILIGPDDGIKDRIFKKIFDLETNDIRIMDYISDPKLAYVDADLLVYPSYYEIFGLVPFEAILCNACVIVTKSSGCGEIIEEINAGYLVEYNNLEQMADTIWEAFQNKEKREGFLKNGKEFIINELDIKKTTAKILNIYEKLSSIEKT